MLAEKALLISLSIKGFWSATTDDHEVENFIGQTYRVDPRVGQYKKKLLDPKKIAELKKVNELRSQLYTYYKEHTVPWLDRGVRMFAADKYMEIVGKINELKQKLLDAYIYEFLPRVPELRDQAKRELNGLFKEQDWPDVEQLREKARVSVKVYPLSDPNDIRVGVSEEERQQIKREAEKAAYSSIAQSVLEIVQRLRVAVEDFVNRVEPYRRDSNGKVVNSFRDSAVLNLRELLRIIPALNVTGNQQIVELCEEIDKAICRIEPQDLRDDDVLRRKTVESAKSIKDRLESVEEILAKAVA